ncbi:hypothetical protein COT27_02210 [Candidatus Kuenenbacteria bacterium CG08_land_8_20_14_0_20_37_23]|uniref:GIY-YIG domain-containing protein n=1 Tax=Candidatus Kuenenbacteria bacterium CG08_land_8_20_14_0_20_37_23 TaxID=1974617 RepID=A0A2M6XSL3_9BACT|nr:MAG: hypothetical protein COT27_02210 [Candidatus Kuenenbacteria bacterium CG08_land_8_20_14_0_20_37_23]
MPKNNIQPGVYILQSLKNKTYYIGSTINIEERFNEHNLGKVAATKHLRPWILMLFLDCRTMTPRQGVKVPLKIE